jgi:mono/diheme cytochrome c family protein
LRNRITLAAVAVFALAAVACRQDMHDQPRYVPLRPSTFFSDGRSARPAVQDTVARGQLKDDTEFYAGKGADGKFIDAFPVAVTRDMVQRGQERFKIYCTPCHSGLGDGNGMIVRRGFRHPPTFHSDRLRKVPNGYLFDVITNGFGAMQDYSAQVSPADRWAIVAYIRALQLSENGAVGDVPAGERAALDAAAGGK